MTDPGGGTFKAGELRDNTSNTTGNINLSEDEFTEIEFVMQATSNSLDNTNYCFRLYDAANDQVLDAYSNYAEAVVVPEFTWIFFGIAPFLPGLIGRLRKDRRGSRGCDIW